MKKIFALFLTIVLMFSFTSSALAQSKVIRKNITKVIKPEIAPEPAPIDKTSEEALPMPEPPAPPSTAPTTKEDKGLFGLGLNSDVNGSYAYNSGQKGWLGLIGGGANIIFDDPASIGSNIGLAQDALEYNAGLGLYLGQDKSDLNMFSLPLIANATLYLKEGSLFGLDPYIGGGLNLNLIGTDSKMGGLGYNLFAGILSNLGWGSGPTGFSIGYRSIKVADIRTAEGIIFALNQPIKL